MRSFAVLLLAALSLAACRPKTGSVHGVVMQSTGGSPRPAANARIVLCNLDSPSRRYTATADASGQYSIAGVAPGAYLRIASAASGTASPMNFLRGMIASAKDLQQLTGYDAISNMPDELKAAIAFGPGVEAPQNDSIPDAALRQAAAARQQHLDATVDAYLKSWPDNMKSLFGRPGLQPVDMLRMQVAAGETASDSVLFALAGVTSTH